METVTRELFEARERIKFIRPLAMSIGLGDANYGQLINDAAVVSDRVDVLERALQMIAEGAGSNPANEVAEIARTALDLGRMCPIFGEARGTSQCVQCGGDISLCPVYGHSQ